MTYLEMLRTQLPLDEGIRPDPYMDTANKLTIGIGRCLTNKPLKRDEILYLFENDLKDCVSDARAVVAGFDRLSDVRKYVVCNMAFELGRAGLAGFTNPVLAMNEGRIEDAARGMKNSKWARQVPARAERLITAWRTDTFPGATP